MSFKDAYPKIPYIGVDCSGEPKDPPMIAVATRWSRRKKQKMWVASITEDQIKSCQCNYEDWQEKLYAALFFRVIDRIIVPNYYVHIDKEFPTDKTERKVEKYLKRLFGLFHSGDNYLEDPEISFHTKQNSELVRHADMKTKRAHRGYIPINEKHCQIEVFVKLLER